MEIKERAEKILQITAIKSETYRVAEANIIGKPGWYDESNQIRDTLQAECISEITAEIEGAVSEERAKLTRAAYALTEIAKMSERLIGGGQIMVMANTILEEIQPPEAEE